MATRSKREAKPKDEPKSLRASVSFPRELYEALEMIAKEKKVSVAWIVRDAAQKYVGARYPLFEAQPSDERRHG